MVNPVCCRFTSVSAFACNQIVLIVLLLGGTLDRADGQTVKSRPVALSENGEHLLVYRPQLGISLIPLSMTAEPVYRFDDDEAVTLKPLSATADGHLLVQRGLHSIYTW